jgi:hypothetical protein
VATVITRDLAVRPLSLLKDFELRACGGRRA